MSGYVVKCTVTDSPFNTEANYFKCPPSVHLTTPPNKCTMLLFHF